MECDCDNTIDDPKAASKICAKHFALLERSVLAEREACAQAALAEDSFMMLQDFGMQSMCTQVRENVAAAIRARSEPRS